MSTTLRAVGQQGFAILRAAVSPEGAHESLLGLERAFEQDSDSTMRTETGRVYGARNVLSLWPEVVNLCHELKHACRAVLGEKAGLVRVLYFDKPPERSWSLPWHKDLTIAVKDNSLPSDQFSKPTRKAGVPHVEAPLELLSSMLIARLHLDDVTEENGPLKVIPGSHRTGKDFKIGDVAPCTILAQTGDVLLMRPLLVHSSGCSVEGTTRHRRILHFEFAATSELPDGYEWHDFIPLSQVSAD